MKIQELTEQEIDINALADEIVKGGMQVYQIVQKLIEPKG
jgi:hypothetical protein